MQIQNNVPGDWSGSHAVFQVRQICITLTFGAGEWRKVDGV
jgi:type IV secretory pathway VirB2 component (pilin)